jgi:hypothetical protein
MIIDVPSYDSDHLPDNLKPKDLTSNSEAVFHWPTGCLWPFGDQRSEGDT